MKIIIKSILLAFVLIFANCGDDDEGTNAITGTISGKVTDAATGSPIEGADVQTQPATSQVSSNSDGDYSIASVDPGQYVVEAEKSSYNSGTVNVSVTAGATTSADLALTSTLSDGLVAYYPFNGNANDESGNGNTGTVQGAALATDRFGNDGSAYHFDGVDDIIGIGNNVKPNFPITVSAWINSDDIDHGPFGQGVIFRNDFWNHKASYFGFQIIQVKGKLLGVVGNGGIAAPWSRSGRLTTDAVFSASTWYHLVVTFHSHDDITFYVDATEYASIDNGGTASSMVYSASSPGAIGNSKDTQFIGKIDDIRVYDRVLTEDEIQALYQEGGD